MRALGVRRNRPPRRTFPADIPDGLPWRTTLMRADYPDAVSGKEARTSFRRLSVGEDGRTSVLECSPLTGRTHQVGPHARNKP